MRSIPITFRALDEPRPGPTWRAVFTKAWPWYREWFLSEGESARAS